MTKFVWGAVIPAPGDTNPSDATVCALGSCSIFDLE